MTIEKLVIHLNALVFFVYGLVVATFPEWTLSLVTGAVPGSESAMVDARASIGGLCMGVGLLMFATALDDSSVRLGVLGVFVITLCMASARLLGILLDGDANQAMHLFFVLELGMAVFAAWLLGRSQD